ncbi:MULTISPECIES: M1 family metallopeptidase [unclassified Bradyrhizobium]|uniref:M1 family metallopeptidase n=1 Tax=unclassified Bradyrhizobium TaxID=2631580 RepID=UPI00247AAE27|nr:MULTISPECIES: M1 family metallopeptidase [unclassified Bradyrhizobium]WGS22054.1 M1 family metallopeptidase [Bradyrhizobium sp. ISRA463]WGS29013.1 M1 family metallopeptidase [Bradyrhizobium sp. ISRA464]
MSKPASHHRWAFLRRVAAATVLLSVAAGARAEQTFSFDSTLGGLPKVVVPVNYAIELTLDFANLVLPGVETVDIEVREPTAQVTLNTISTTFGDVSADDGAQRAAVTTDAAAQTATLTFAQPLAAGRHKLRIAFTAQINKFGSGLFSVDYPTRTGMKRLISSKLEPANARRIFPCWDEPAFKATFALSVVIPRNLLAVGNMPVASEAQVSDNLKRVTFAPTPRMSSYLFVLTVGELARVTADAGGVTLGVVTTQGKTEQGRFALDSAVKLLAYYNDYFGVKYPLPKLDLIAVPGGFGGAMENWGGITFFESRLLFDPATNAESARRGIFAIIAHEMAHMWFGDLVTMAWWDNLWLNEGFASWMATKASEHFYPQWQNWLNGYGAKQFAMALDARRTSHPIQQPIADHSEAVTAFDAITYNKGQALIRMLENYLGAQAFRDGIRKYMAVHAYSNSTTADLWQALESAAGKRIAGVAASSYLALLDALDIGDHRAVWDQVISSFAMLDRLARARDERPVIQAYARAKLRPVFDRLGWEGGPADDDTALLRASLIRTLGDFGDKAIVAEAKRRFAAFLVDSDALPNALRDPVTHLVGITADRSTYDTLLALARKSTVTNERLRYYFAAASSHDPALAQATLALTLTNELPDTIVPGMIGAVASAGEQPQLAWDFVRNNFDALLAKQGPNFRDQFVPNLMANFTDAAHAAELAAFAPSQSTSGGRMMVARALESIAISGDLQARMLPVVGAWIRAHKQ